MTEPYLPLPDEGDWAVCLPIRKPYHGIFRWRLMTSGGTVQGYAEKYSQGD